jgi:hypothetical protein
MSPAGTESPDPRAGELQMEMEMDSQDSPDQRLEGINEQMDVDAEQENRSRRSNVDGEEVKDEGM